MRQTCRPRRIIRPILLHINPDRSHNDIFQRPLPTRRSPQIRKPRKTLQHGSQSNRTHFTPHTRMFSPSKVNVLVERTIEFDFCRIREHRGVFVGVILKVSIAGGGGRDQVDEDTVTRGARDFSSSVVDDDVFCTFAQYSCCGTNDTTTFHDISCQFGE
jgi:hypothetical protein